jgi:hypothetical protein
LILTVDGSSPLRARSALAASAIVVTATMPCPHIVLQPSLCMKSTPAWAVGGHRLGEQRAVHVGVARGSNMMVRRR